MAKRHHFSFELKPADWKELHGITFNKKSEVVPPDHQKHIYYALKIKNTDPSKEIPNISLKQTAF